MAHQTAITFPKFSVLPSELRYSIWEALWDSIKDENSMIDLVVDCMGTGYTLVDSNSDLEFASCVESRREFIRLFTRDFQRKTDEIQVGLVSLGCKNTTKPQITILKKRRNLGLLINGKTVFQAYFSMLCRKGQYHANVRNAKSRNRRFAQNIRKVDRLASQINHGHNPEAIWDTPGNK